MGSPDRGDTALVVELYSDIVCPWCFVGNERLERVIAARGPDDPAVTVRHHPFLLDPDTPPEGWDVPAMLRARYGVTDPKRIWERVEAEARKAGIDLDLSNQPRAFLALAAHTLVRAAEARGTGRAVVRALYRGYFLEGRNIADGEVLADIGVLHGFSVEEVARLVRDQAALEVTRREAESAVAAGITGVPFFVVGGRFAISGAQPEEVLRAALARAAEEARVGVA